jgi:hypothetical protein
VNDIAGEVPSAGKRGEQAGNHCPPILSGH